MSPGTCASVHYLEAGQTADGKDSLAHVLERRKEHKLLHSDTRPPDRLVMAVVELSWGPGHLSHLSDCFVGHGSAPQADPNLACVSEKLSLSILLQCPASGKEHSPARR